MSRGSGAGQVVLHLFLALVGLAVGFLLYLFLLLGQPLHRRVAVVDSLSTVSLDAVRLDEESGDAVPWEQSGRTRVFVHEDFPIRKVEQRDPDIENVLVFGIDARSPNHIAGRADTMVILTIDKKHLAIKLTSLLRDTSVNIDGRSQPSRLNDAYALGGIGLLLNTINETFSLDIQRFAMFDFGSAAGLIDALGGVEVDIRSEEIDPLNANIRDMNRLTDHESSMIDQPGRQRLDGRQAIAWARIRQFDSEYAGTDRQRTVMTRLIDQYTNASVSSLVAMAGDGLAAFETNMTNVDLIRLGISALPLADDVLQYSIPEDGLFRINPDPWMMIVDYDRQIPALHAFIYGDGFRD